jgi:hypothetical protein
MQHRATLKYSERLIIQAVRSYWRRSIGLGTLVAVVVVSAMLAWRLAEGDTSWRVGLLAAVVGFGIIMPLAVYLVHYKNSMSKFREMADPVATLVAEESSFTLSSDRGSSTLGWGAITEVWRFETYWLLLFSRTQFATLPLDGISEQMRAYVLERVRCAGGKIAV